MNEILELDQSTIDKIAAGEVVERPSSVVKELVENAIDAGATAVTVEIADGGKKLIRITDNGSGIEMRQVPAAFKRHATSKIRLVEDLETISSFGFRGEALSSIAAVSQVEMITRTASAMSGTRYLINGGKEEKIEETGAPEGTTLLVRSLFYNTPARSKFLKSDATEANYISTLMEQLAMSHPEVSFKYIQNRQVRLHTSGNCSRKEVIYNIYGRDIARQLIEVSCETDFMRVSGFIGKPEIARGNRSFENYYINGRFVRDRIIAKAIEDGYKGFLMQHRFPFVSLDIEMNGNELDVNVHPSKMEVRFARGTEVYEAICRMVHDALCGRSLIPSVKAGREERNAAHSMHDKPASVPEPFEVRRRMEEGKSAPDPGRNDEMSGSMQNEKKPGASQNETPGSRIPGRTGTSPYGVNYERVLSRSEEQLFAGKLADAAMKTRSEQASDTGIISDALTGAEEVKVFENSQAPDAVNIFEKRSGSVLKGEAEKESGSLPVEEVEKQSGSLPVEEAKNESGSVLKGDAEKQSCSVLKSEAEKQPDSAPAAEPDTIRASEARALESTAVSAPADNGSFDRIDGCSGSSETGSESGQMSLFGEQFLAPESRNRIRIIGQLFDTYWLAEFGESFFIIDQHAAHEKVFYERFLKRFRERRMESQNLCPALIVTLTMEEEAVLAANMERFIEAGFEIDNFGGREYSAGRYLSWNRGTAFQRDAGQPFIRRCRECRRGVYKTSCNDGLQSCGQRQQPAFTCRSSGADR